MVATLAGTYTDPDTVIALKLNGGTLCRVPKGGASDAILNPFVLAPGDELEFEVSNSDSTAWSLEFRLYPQGDVAYEEP